MSTRFADSPGTQLTAANINSLDRGGNVYPSAAGGLIVDIAALIYWDQTSVGIQTYAGAVSQAVTNSQTNYVYLDDTGTLVNNITGFPTAKTHIPLATVVCAGNVITAINDKRPAMGLQSGPYLLADPGTGNPISVVGWTNASIGFEQSGATAETNTCPDAEREGQTLFLHMHTYGSGSREVTFASAIDSATHTKWKSRGLRECAVFRSDKNKKWNVFNSGGLVS